EITVKESPMLIRSVGCLAMVIVLMTGGVRATAQEASPTILVQIRSLDAVIDNVKLLVALSGRENIANQVEGLIKAKVGPQGLEGIDPKPPFGVYGQFKAINNATGVALIPILDETAFLNLLKNLGLDARKNDKTGIYTIGGLPVEVYLR